MSTPTNPLAGLRLKFRVNGSNPPSSGSGSATPNAQSAPAVDPPKQGDVVAPTGQSLRNTPAQPSTSTSGAATSRASAFGTGDGTKRATRAPTTSASATTAATASTGPAKPLADLVKKRVGRKRKSILDPAPPVSVPIVPAPVVTGVEPPRPPSVPPTMYMPIHPSLTMYPPQHLQLPPQEVQQKRKQRRYGALLPLPNYPQLKSQTSRKWTRKPILLSTVSGYEICVKSYVTHEDKRIVLDNGQGQGQATGQGSVVGGKIKRDDSVTPPVGVNVNVNVGVEVQEKKRRKGKDGSVVMQTQR